MRSLSAALAAGSIAVGLVGGCSSPSSPPPSPPSSGSAGASSSPPASTKTADAPLPDPAALLTEASATAQGLQSAHLTMSVVGKVAEMPVKQLAAELINEHGAAANNDAKDDDAKDDAADTEARGNAAAKGTGKVAILGSEIDFHFVVVGGHMYVSLPGAGWADYGHPTRPYSVTSLLGLDEGLANVLNNFVDPKVEGRETVSDHQTIRVTGKVTPVAVNKFIPQLGATDRMPATVWIQESGDRQVVEISLEPSTDNFVQLAFSDWNKPVTIEKPPGV